MSHATAEARARVPDWIALAALTLAGAWLRFAAIGTKSLWYDEATWYHLVQGGWRGILAANAATNSAPPLFPLLVGLLTGPGASEAALRAPAAVAGVLGVPLAWWLAREFTGARLALVAALLVACSPVQVEYAQQLREYSAAFATACLVLIAYSRFMDRPGVAQALAVAAAGTLGLLVQYGTALLIAGLALVALAGLRRAPERSRAFSHFVLAHAALAAAGVILFLTCIRSQLKAVSPGAAGYLSDRYWDGTAGGLVTLLAGERANLAAFAFPGALAPGLMLIGLVASLARRAPPRAAAFLLAPVTVTVLASLAGAYPYGAIRQDMMLMPMFPVCASIGLAVIARSLGARFGTLPAAVVATVAAIALAWAGTRDSLALLRFEGSEPMRPIAAELAQRMAPGERIYVYWGAIPAFGYYWREREEPWTRGTTHWSGLGAELAAAQMKELRLELAEFAADPRPFWLVLSHMAPDDADELLLSLRERADFSVVMSRQNTTLLNVRPRP